MEENDPSFVEELQQELQENGISDLAYVEELLEESQIRFALLRNRLGWALQEVDLGSISPQEFVTKVNDLLKRVGDCTRCNNSCKSLYFCDKELNHEGHHQDGNLAW